MYVGTHTYHCLFSCCTYIPLFVFFFSVFQNNTFQAVLATNGIESYVFFLYDNLEWTNTDTDSVTAAEELPQVSTSIYTFMAMKRCTYLHDL